MSLLPKTILLTALAMIAFAANSVLTRLALAPGLIDAATFSGVRIGSGVLILWVILAAKGQTGRPFIVHPGMVLGLFVYVTGFSFAYITLGAGTGALILFASVQFTMLIWAFYQGERFSLWGWVGLFLAFGGLVYLLLPGATAPDEFGAFLMVLAGVAWGVYSICGKSAGDPLKATAWNFLLCFPLCLVIMMIFSSDMHVTTQGILLAMASGAIASGIGYVIWYAALPLLQGKQAAVVQLSVPIIAAIGGALFIAEPLTVRTLIAGLMTLGGIWLVLAKR